MKHPYTTLMFVLTINAVAMFFIGYAMISVPDHFYFNLNRVYMVLMMVSPLALLMLMAMRSMFQKKALNFRLYIAFIVLFLVPFALVRTQATIGNEQFLRSMIPHHSSAVLMCEQAAVTDPEIIKLCGQIVTSQKAEIEQMKAILARIHPAG